MNTYRGFPLSVLGIMLMAVSLITVACGKKQDTDLEQSEPKTDAPQQFKSETVTEEDLAPDTIVARVNEREIEFSELQSRMEELILSLPQTPPPDVLQREIPALLERVLNDMVINELLEKAIVEEDVTVPESDVVKRVRQTAARMPDGKKLSEVLEERGSSLKEFQENIGRELAIQKLLEKHTSNTAETTAAEVESFYNDNPDQFNLPEMASAHHILIPFRPDDSDEFKAQKLKEIQDIRAQIVAGADFEEMAREYSSGPTAQNGGNLGRFPRGQMLKSFDDAAFSQEIDAVGEPVETSYGYHIIRVDERQPARKVTLDEARPNIREYLSNHSKQTALKEYLDSLRNQSDIEILRDISKISVKFNPEVTQPEQ